MTVIGRRSVLVAPLIVPVAHIPLALAVDALPDARFVGFAQAVNDFDLASGQMALQRSGNENIRGYATRIIADANYDASALRLSSSEAGVSYAPDGAMGPKTQNLLAELNTLQGPAFDTAFAQGQLSVQTDCEARYRAYSQNGKSGPLKRYAQTALPKAKGTPRPGTPAGRRPLRAQAESLVPKDRAKVMTLGFQRILPVEGERRLAEGGAVDIARDVGRPCSRTPSIMINALRPRLGRQQHRRGRGSPILPRLLGRDRREAIVEAGIDARDRDLVAVVLKPRPAARTPGSGRAGQAKFRRPSPTTPAARSAPPTS